MLTGNHPGSIVPDWAAFFSYGQYSQFIQHVLSYFSGSQISYRCHEGAILHVDSETKNPGRMGLLNLAQLCRLKPAEEWGPTVRLHFDGLMNAAGTERMFSSKAHDFAFVKDHIAVRIYPTEYINMIRDGLIIGRAVADGLYAMLVFDLPDSIVGIRPEQTVQWEMTNQELFELGVENIRSRYRFRPTRQLLGGVGFHLLVEDHHYASNILFDLEKMDALKTDHGILVGVPNRHAVLIHPVTDVKVMRAMNRMIPAIHGMYKDGPGSVSEKLYWLRDGKFTPVPYTIDSENILLDPPESFLDVMAFLSRDEGKSVA